MALTSIKFATDGSNISFRSKNPNDTVVWKGVLESRGTYRSILGLENPAPYNQAVRQSDPSVPSDETLLSYFTITVDNDSSIPVTKVFADEWIQPGSLNEIALGNKVTLQVDDPLNNTQAILSLLASAGYACKVVS